MKSLFRFGLCLGAGILITVIVLSMGPMPTWILQLNHSRYANLKLTDRLTAEQGLRTIILQAVGGILLVFGAIATWRQILISRQQLMLGRDARITESFAKAIESLAADGSIARRVAGVYALDRIARKEPEERVRIIEILTAFVRQPPAHLLDTPPADVQAALVVLGGYHHNAQLMLDGARLRGASLIGIKLPNASLRNAILRDSILRESDLRGTCLSGADLRNVDLRGADLRGANLDGANLDGISVDGSTRMPPLDSSS